MKGAALLQSIRPAASALTAAVLLSLGGCLEVEQYPAWSQGEYNGKADNLPAQAYFSNDRLAWNAALANRTHLQNEYGRMDQPSGGQ
jgi:hypothetical protein